MIELVRTKSFQSRELQYRKFNCADRFPQGRANFFKQTTPVGDTRTTRIFRKPDFYKNCQATVACSDR